MLIDATGKRIFREGEALRPGETQTGRGICFTKPGKAILLAPERDHNAVNRVKVVISTREPDMQPDQVVRVGLTPMNDIDEFHDIQKEVRKNFADVDRMRLPLTTKNLVKNNFIKCLRTRLPEAQHKQVADLVADGWLLHENYGKQKPRVISIRERDMRSNLLAKAAKLEKSIELLVTIPGLRPETRVAGTKRLLSQRNALLQEYRNVLRSAES